MRSSILVLAFAFLTGSTASAQEFITLPPHPSPSQPSQPRFDLALGYRFGEANAPPAGCKCFGLNGGFASATLQFKPWLGLGMEASGSHASNISVLGQNLNLVSVVAGPKVFLPMHRFRPFGEFMVGEAHGSDSYFPAATGYTTSASSLAISAGGGVDIAIKPRLALQVGNVQYMRTSFPNGTDNVQRHLVIETGLLIRLGHLRPTMVAEVAPELPPVHNDIAFNCLGNTAALNQGDSLEIVASTATKPDSLDVSYNWSSTGGVVQGKGREVTINTAGLAEGSYRVTGHAFATADPGMGATCDVNFRVRPQIARIQPPVTSMAVAAISGPAVSEVDFHEHVPDMLFDYDSSKIRPDAWPKIVHAVEYLDNHPRIQVMVNGYADERGSAEYNLSLGQERAIVARNALISAGISPDRVQITSYGKEIQVCSSSNELCWQQNRRAAFEMHP